MTEVTIDQAIQIATQHQQSGKLAEAESICRQILEVMPGHATALYLLGLIAAQAGHYQAAVDLIQKAISASPRIAAYHADLGVFQQTIGQLDSAIASYQQAISLQPDNPDFHYNLADAWRRKGQLDDAIAEYQKSLALRPDFFEAHSNLGDAYSRAGMMDQAVACLRRAIALKPDAIVAHNNLLYCLGLRAESDARQMHDEFLKWNARHAYPLKQYILPHGNERSTDRRLRIGYVSPDLWMHPVGRFMLPLLMGHDRKSFEIFCYAQVPAPDAITEQLKLNADTWRNIVGQSDEQVCEMIRTDQIDILVDLAMHLSQNRARVFARKPAPVQVAYLAYPGGSGLDTIDYRLTDRYLDPDESTDQFYLQKSMRLSGSYWCYQQTFTTPEVNELPALTDNRVTLGCLNSFRKVTQNALETWADAMQQIPGSRLLLHTPQGSHRNRIIKCLEERGISADRLETIGMVSPEEYFRIYQRIDIALDPFPYAGGTTTCDALWMGVPVVTLAGQSAIARSGVSILSNVGLPELIARTPVEYIQIVKALANDLPGLKHLRSTLRGRLQKSPLMDRPRYVLSIEQAYRAMWADGIGSSNIKK